MKGVWVRFPQALLDDYLKCLEYIKNKSLRFLYVALNEGSDGTDIEDYFMPAEKEQFEDSCAHVEGINKDQVLFSIRFWLGLRKLTLPLKPSKRIVPLIASSWNRSKNGSDIATACIRRSWFDLPPEARTPQAYVVHRMLYLSLYNIKKIAAIFNKRSGETMDKWRKRTNKSQGSFKIFVYYIQQQVVKCRLNEHKNLARMTTTPRTPSHPSQSQSATFQVSSRTNSSTLSTPIRVRVAPEHEVTNRTPKRRVTSSTNSFDVGARIKGCRGHLVKICTSSGNKKTRSCYRCKTSTSFQCSGCHLYFCCKPQSEPSTILDSVPDSWKRTPEVIEVNMGTATKWVKKDNGKRTKADVAVVQYVVPTCHLMAHLSEAYVEEEISIQPGTS
jgi:hypothetical protein